jgi:phosphate-selective porin OprO and OprP
MLKPHIPCAFALALTSALPALSYAEQSDSEARIHQLEQMMQQLQQQRAEQDKQIELLTKELVGVENQVSQSKITKTEEKGKSQGNPVYGAFKDGLVFDDGSGNWKLQVNGRVQTDYRDYDPEWKSDTFSVRRARLGASFTFLKDFTMRVEGEYANTNDGSKGTTALTYGYLDYTHWQGAKIRAGQFKPFFGLERSDSTNFTDFTELSLATNNGANFNSTYDRGVMLFGDPTPWLNYNAYAINGTGQNNDDVNNVKDVGGRVDVNFASLAQIKDAVIDVGGSVSQGSLSFSSATGSLTQATEANGATFFSVSGLGLGNPAPTSHRDRWGLESALAYGPVKLQTEYIGSSLEGWQGKTHFDNDIRNWYVNLNWLVTGESYADSYKSGVFGRIRPKHNFDDKDGWGAFELGLRYSKFDASDFESLLTNATKTSSCPASATTCYTSEADAWTAGAKWIFNPNARLVLNYVHTEFDTPIKLNGRVSDDEDAVVLRAQYDF